MLPVSLRLQIVCLIITVISLHVIRVFVPSFYSDASLSDSTLLNFSKSDAYTRHYTVPPNSIDGYPDVRAKLSAHLSAALKTASHPSLTHFNHYPTSAITVDPSIVSSGYRLRTTPIQPLCPGTLARISIDVAAAVPPCLTVLHNAYFSTSGTALQPSTNTIFELTSGCCSKDWPKYMYKKISLTPSELVSRKKYFGRIVLVLSHHHSSTYHHVLHDVLPKFLYLLPLIEAFPDLLIAIDDSRVSTSLFRFLNVSNSNIIQLPSVHQPHWTFASVLLYPPPVFMMSTRSYFPPSLSHTTAAVLREASLSKPMPGRNLVLLQRARSRFLHGLCREPRCVTNFEQLKKALTKTFAGRFNVLVYNAQDEIETAIRMFSSAKVVVGVHGGGFQNLMFCSPGTTVVHIGFDHSYRYLAREFNVRYHGLILKGLKRESKSIMLDVDRIVRSVVVAVNEDEMASKDMPWAA